MVPQIDPAATTPIVPIEARRRARSLYWRGWAITQIAEELGLKLNTVASWKRRGEWDKAPSAVKIEDGLEERYLTLIAKEAKTGGDFKEIDLLGRQLERNARVRKFAETGKEGDLNPKVANRNNAEVQEKRAANRKEKGRNFLTLEQWQDLLDDFHKRNFEYQELWWTKRKRRSRKIRKSRQTGATWYFAREALAKIAEWVLDGEQPRNQIFLSASQRQARKFKREIYNWVRRVTGVELKGDIVMLDFLGVYPQEDDDHKPVSLDSVGLYFLSTNTATAQGESGDFYFDEYAWVHGFAELNKVASGMATHKIYTRTYFSTASSRTHESASWWYGEDWNRGRAKADQRPFDCSLKNLRLGADMPDGSWQHLLNIHDACAMGLGKLVDVEEIRQERSEDEFRNLYEGDDVDDTESAFPFAALAPCRVDSFYTWKDFKSAEPRPYADAPVSIGYDPDKGGRDGAALTITALPSKPGGKFRLLEKISLKGKDYEQQADAIKRQTRRYNVTDIAIDTSGAGDGVFQIVVKWFPSARRIDYTVWAKAQLVRKMQAVIRRARFEYDAGWSDVSSAFMAIRPTVVGKTVTFAAGRGGNHGHADVAWAVMHSVSIEPMDANEVGQQQSEVEFFE